MDLLSNLPYTCFDGFYIRVDKINNGWMDLCVGKGDKRLCYSASCIGDPLNYLLAAAVSVVRKQKSASSYNGVTYTGEYLYITHDLEPSMVTWLFKLGNGQLTLIIWEDMPPCFEELVVRDFECGLSELKTLYAMPNITGGVCLAIKDSPVAFIKALLNAVEGLSCLERCENADDDEWGHSYSLDDVELLKSWLLKNDAA
jgi:hypothetical protein